MIILTGLFILLIIISMQIINSSTGNYDRYYLMRKLNDKELVWDGAIQWVETVSENHFRQNSQHESQGAGSRQTDRPYRVSADSAEGGICTFGAWKIADDCAGSALCLGRGESTDRVITSSLPKYISNFPYFTGFPACTLAKRYVFSLIFALMR